jgi:hypothetical protein
MPFKKGMTAWNKGKKLKNRAWNKGKHLSKEHKEKIREHHKNKPGFGSWMKGSHWSEESKLRFKDRVGEKANAWKGESAGKIAVHMWITSRKGSPDYCEHCGKTGKGRYHWSNIDHKYSRNLDDYTRLCPSCHMKYDMKYNNYNEKRNLTRINNRKIKKMKI